MSESRAGTEASRRRVGRAPGRLDQVRAPGATSAAAYEGAWGMYRQGVPGSGLSIEQATGDVPSDGRYYVISGGVIHRGYRSLRDATATYERLRAAVRAEAAAAASPAVAPVASVAAVASDEAGV